MYIFEPKVRKAFGIAKDEAIAGLLYLTDLEEVPPKAKRKNKHLISEYKETTLKITSVVSLIIY